jgi:FtsH-binding integral membrane protein
MYVAIAAILVGCFGYATERRKRGAKGARNFLLWYAFAVPFMACALCGTIYHRLHWLYYVAGAMAVAAVLVQRRGLRNSG